MDIPRLSSTERLILELLAGEEMFGLQLVEQSKGSLKRGTVYVTLGRMQDKGIRRILDRGATRRRDRPATTPLSTDGIRRRILQAWETAARALPPPPESAARLMVPGRMLHRLAGHLCSTKALERVIEPAIADLQKEYGDAIRGGRVWYGRRILFAGYVGFAKAIAICGIDWMLSSSLDMGLEERRAIGRTLVWGGLIIVAMTVAMVIPPLAEHPISRSGALQEPLCAGIDFPGVAAGDSCGTDTRRPSRPGWEVSDAAS